MFTHIADTLVFSVGLFNRKINRPALMPEAGTQANSIITFEQDIFSRKKLFRKCFCKNSDVSLKCEQMQVSWNR